METQLVLLQKHSPVGKASTHNEATHTDNGIARYSCLIYGQLQPHHFQCVHNTIMIITRIT